MNAVVDQATVEIIANVSKYLDGLQTAGNGTARFAQQTGNEVGKLSEKFQQLAGFIAAGFAVHKIVELGKAAIDTADEVSKLSQKVGISTEALSTYRHMADLSDVSNEKLQVGLVKLSRTLGEGAAGSPGQVAAFRAIGISQEFLVKNANDTDAVFKKVIERFGEYEDGTNKTRLAVELFGKSGADMIPLLNSGAKGYAAAAEEAKKFGLVIDGTVAKQAEEFNDNLTRMGKIVDGIANQAMAKLIPKLAEASTKFIEWASSGDGLAKVAEHVGNALVFVADHIDEIILVAKIWLSIELIKYFGGIAEATIRWTITLVENAIAQRAAASAAAEMGMKTKAGIADSIKQIGAFNIALGAVQAAVIGWQIGTYLRNEFVIVRQAGDIMVGLFLIGWEKLKQGGTLAWMMIKVAVQDFINEAREAAAVTLDFAAKLASLNPMTPQALIDKYKEWADTIRGTIAPTDGLRVQMALVTNEADKNVAAIQKDVREMIAYEASLANAGKGVQTLTTLTVDAGKEQLNFSANAGKGAEAADKHAKILAQLQQMALKAGGAVGGPLAEAYADYLVEKAKALELEREGIALGGNTVAITNATTEAVRALGKAYEVKAAAIQKDQQFAANTLAGMREEIRLLGLSTAERRVAAVVTDTVREAKQRHVDLNGTFIASEEELTRVLQEQLPAFEAQVRQLDATRDAIEKQQAQWQKYKDIVSQTYDSMIDKGVEWAMSGFKNAKEFWRGMVDLVKDGVKQMLVEWAKTKIIGWLGQAGSSMGGFWGAAAGMAATWLGGSSGGGAGGGAGAAGGITSQPAAGFNYGGQSAVNGGGGGYGGTATNMVGNWAVNQGGQYLAQGAAGQWVAANAGTLGYAGGIAGAVGGAYYGSQQGDGGIGTVGSTAAGAIAGYYAGTVAMSAFVGASAGAATGVAGAATTGAIGGASGAAAAIPIVGWIAALALIVDGVTGGAIFGSKYRPNELHEKVNFGADGVSASAMLNEWKYVSQGSQFLGRIFTGGALLPSDWKDTEFRNRQLDIDPKMIEALQEVFEALGKTAQAAAKKLKTDVVGMLDASFETKTFYDRKGKVERTETVGTIRGVEYKEDFGDFQTRMHAELLIETLEQLKTNASSIAQAYRENAQELMDAAQTMVQAQADLQDGKGLLGGGTDLTSIMAWIEKQQIGDEELLATYARLARATAEYNGILERADEALKQLANNGSPIEQMKAALEGIQKNLTTNIDALNAAAEAAGLAGAAEKDLAKLRELAAAQINKISTDFYKGIEGQITALNATHTPTGDFADAMRSIRQTMADNVAQANILAIAQGRSGASAQELGRIYTLAASQAAAAIAQLRNIGLQQVQSLYGGPLTLDQLDAQIAELQNQAQQATQSVGGFGNAMSAAASQANEAINLLIGDKSPFNDQIKLQFALGGLQRGEVSQDAVLEIGRRLYASTSQYTTLFNQVMAMGPRGAGGASLGGGGFQAPQQQGLSQEDKERLADLLKQREAMIAAQRLEEARGLAQTLATFANVQGMTFEEVAADWKFSLKDLAKDLGMTDEELQKYLENLRIEEDKIPNALETQTDRLIAVLNALFNKPEFGALAPGDPDKPVPQQINKLEAVRMAVTTSGDRQEALAKETNNGLDRINQSLRDFAAAVREDSGLNSTRSVRYGETGVLRR